MSYAEVAVNSPIAQRRTFSYSIPPDIPLTMGQAVRVPFGSKLLQGIVFELTDYPAVEETKQIAGVIDTCPLLSPVQLELARWMSQHYLVPLFDAVSLMLPPGFERKLITFFHLSSSPSEVATSSLTSEQKKVVNLFQSKRKVALQDVEKVLGKKRAQQVLAQLLRHRLVMKSQELERVKVKPKLAYELRLAIPASRAKQEAEHLPHRAPKQAALLEFLAAQSQPIPLSEAKNNVHCSLATARALQDKGLISIEQVQVRRDPLLHRTFPSSIPPTLTPAQEEAVQRIQACLVPQPKDGAATFLLHGITGSGKTEVYLHALGRAIALGKRGIVLVPEIALTPQAVERFASRFPQRVAVLHSKLSLGEQFDEWQRIREGAFDVIIGSRGAIFAPQPDLGLIIIDEEHEWTYKQQDQSPRYHAREVALKLAELTGAVVVLGSATPDVESFYWAQTGKYQLLELPQRVSLRSEPHLPEVEVVDLRQELKAGNRSIFSRSLSQAINETLEASEQVILFLNRRGTATFVQCRNCGFVLKCRRCDLPLTYHAPEELVCHQCNWRKKTPKVCPECSSSEIKFLGLGTQKVEQEAARLFPKARLLRWDRDTTGGKYSHEEILNKFLTHQADILIGTQMIAKGLDLPSVTLVGVISADTSLHLPDFRACERTFQLLCQVGGRAGRGAWPGKVIIQTYTPEHYAITAAKHDYTAFYQREINYRREHENPPFSRLAYLLYTHTNAAHCQKEAQRVFRELNREVDFRGIPNITLIGPFPAFIHKSRGRFRWQIIIRGSDPTLLLAEVPLPQGWRVDIDPISLV